MPQFQDRDDRYDSRRLLGEGAGGQVWSVRDRQRAGLRCALKERTAPDAAGEEALRREFAVLAGLRHPNLAQAYDFDHAPENGAPRFSLELIRGVDFVQAVRREGPSVFLPLAAEALRTLDFLHDFGLLHRDLKPANLLVRDPPSQGARVVILDFGLASADATDSVRHAPLGTLPYIAPEVLDGAGASRRSDLYAFGALLHEAVHGVSPFVPDSGDLPAFVRAVREGLRTPRPLPAGYPPGLGGFIDALLETDPAGRPASAGEALARLNAACGVDLPLETPETRRARLESGDPPGREALLDRMRRELSPRSTRRLLWLAGDAGSGKSRVLRALAADHVGRGWDVLWRLPLDERQDGNVEIHDAVDGALSALRLRARQLPTLVLLDELESASPAQVHFLRRFAGEAGAEPLAVVAALRPNEIRHAGLRELVHGHLLQGTGPRFDLDPLEPDEIARVATRADPDHEPTRERVDWLLEASDGNPLRLADLLLQDADPASERPPVRPTLNESVARQLEGLSVAGRRWLSALALLGSDTRTSLIARLAELSDDEAQVAAAEVQARRLAMTEQGAWAPASRLLASHLVQDLGAEEFKEVSARAAQLLEAEAPADAGGEAARLARLWRQAGDEPRAQAASLRAADLEEGRGAVFEAAGWIRFALAGVQRRDPSRRALRLRHAELLERYGTYLAAARAFGTVLRGTSAPEERIALLARRSRCLSMARRPRAGLRSARRARDLAAEHPTGEAAARAAEGLALHLSGRNEEAIAVLRDGLAHAKAPAEEADLLSLLATAESILWKLDDARSHQQQGLRLARRAGDAETEGRLLMGAAIVEQRAWRPEAALAALDRARAHAARHRLRSQEMLVLINQALQLHDMGRYDRAIRRLAEAEPLALHLGNRNAFLQCRLLVANNLIQVGRPAQAAAQMQGVIDGSHSGFEPMFVKYAQLTLAEALLALPTVDAERVASLLGDLLAPGPHVKLSLGALTVELERRVAVGGEPFDPAWKRYTKLRDGLIEKSETPDPSLAARALLARAAASLEAGDEPGALEAARAAAELAEEKGFLALAARGRALVARAAERQGSDADARASWTAGRRALDAAAARIEDSAMRNDFLARPVFAALRQAISQGGADQERVSALYDMIHALNSETDPERLLVSMLDMALRVVGAERGMILLREDEADAFVPRVARNLEQETIDDVTQFSQSVVRQAGGGEAVLSVDAGHDSRLDAYKSVSLYGIRSVICVPLRSRGRLIGVVYVDDRSERGLFSEHELKFLQAFADHAGLALENAQVRGELERENQRLRVVAESRAQYANMVGRSPAMQEVFSLIERVAETRLPVLIQGESGTGKELVAKAIHFNGPLKQKPFLTENCAAIPETLLESELFGHVKGAFTGADRDREGLFEQADGGTLFLDEVGDMSAGMQARLLRVLQEGELRRVGGSRTITVDVRVLAATHRDLQAEVAKGRFREDLLYRLQVLLIELPPLRDRPGDIPLLIDHILPRIAKARERPAPRIRVAVMDLLERYPWPGNVRQLESTLQRLVLLAGDGPVTLELVESDRTLQHMLGQGDRRHPAVLRQESDKERLIAALSSSDGNRARAAKLLGISRATVFRRIKEYGL